MSEVELSYEKRKTAAEGIAAAINTDGVFKASTWCKPTTKSGYPAVNIYMQATKEDGTEYQFLSFTVTKTGYVNIKQLVDGTDDELVQNALAAIQTAAGLEYAPRIHPDYTNIVPFSQLNKEKGDDQADSKPNVVDMTRFIKKTSKTTRS